MKTRIYVSLAAVLFLLPLLSVFVSATVADTAWTFTLPENEYVKDAFFTEDDSLLVCYIVGLNGDTSYFANYNSYTGELVKKVKFTSEFGSPMVYDVSYKDTIIFLYSKWAFYPDTINVMDKKIRIFNYLKGVIVDSLVPSLQDSDLKWDTCNIMQVEYTPVGEQLFMRANVIKSYGYDSIPEWTQKLFVWNTNNWTLERKRPFGNRAWFEIAPNNRYYFEPIINPGEYYLFDDMNSDSTIYTLQDNDSIKYEGVIFPKTDTNKFLVRYFDNNDARYKIQVRSQTDFSIIKTIDNDTIYYNSLMFLKDSRFLIFYGAKDSLLYRLVVYDLDNENNVYVYPYYTYVGNNGNGTTAISNNSELIFDGYSRTLRMLNAKYTTTSTKEQDKENPGLIFPNPAEDYIELNTSNHTLKGVVGDVRIFDVLGMEITTPSLRDTPPYQGGEIVRIDISGLAPGVYFVQVGDIVRKFVKL